jgi:hypothetical protein
MAYQTMMSRFSQLRYMQQETKFLDALNYTNNETVTTFQKTLLKSET